MSTIIDELKKKSNFYCEKGASIDMIEKAERALGLKFDDDYKTYLQQFGSVSCGGHELTGISMDIELDVVKVTLKNLENNKNVKDSLYVIEETHIDGIVIWQSENGMVFKTEYKESPQILFKSLMEYVSSFENNEDTI